MTSLRTDGEGVRHASPALPVLISTECSFVGMTMAADD